MCRWTGEKAESMISSRRRWDCRVPTVGRPRSWRSHVDSIIKHRVNKWTGGNATGEFVWITGDDRDGSEVKFNVRRTSRRDVRGERIFFYFLKIPSSNGLNGDSRSVRNTVVPGREGEGKCRWTTLSRRQIGINRGRRPLPPRIAAR